MITFIYCFIIVASMFTVVFLAAYTFMRCESKKRKWFMALLSAVFLFLLGTLLGAVADSVSAAFAGIQVEYIGATMLVPVTFLFVADYCEVKIKNAVTAILLAIPVPITVLLWSTAWHGLIYKSFEYAESAEFGHLAITPGPLYYIMYVYTLICMVVSLIFLVKRLFQWDAVFRSNLMLLIAGVLTPTIFSVIHGLDLVINGRNFNLTPLAMTVVCVLLCVNIIKYNLLDIIPKATELVLQSIKEAYLILNMNFELLQMNEAAKRLFPELQTGMNVNEIENWPLKEAGSYFAIPFEMPENRHFIANISTITDRHKNPLGFVYLIQDVTDSVIAARELENLAYIDPLTGLMNMRQFLKLIPAQIERTKRLKSNAFIITFDIDHFKKVNDTYGHSIGDKVLQCIAERIEKEKRPYDLFGRYGGEEFIMFISDITEEDILNYVERIRLTIYGNLMIFGNLTLTVSASFGIASVLSAKTLDDIIQLSDRALFQAKNEGRNRAVLI